MKNYLEKFAIFFIGVTFALGFAWFFAPHSERRFVLYHIRNEVEKQMPKDQVEEIISRHQTPYLRKIETHNGFNLLADLGFANFLSMTIEFSDDKLKKVKISGTDSPNAPKDAPPDIE